MPNFRLTLAYDGTGYRGWQAQPGGGSIQQCLAAAVQAVTGESAVVHGSGRTDAGVHALGQVAHVHLRTRLPAVNLQKALNARLPPAIRVLGAAEAAAAFHARRDALAKTYRYRWYRGPVCPPFLYRYVHHYPYPLDEAAMAAAAGCFLGRHDFTSLAAAGGDRRAERAADGSLGAASEAGDDGLAPAPAPGAERLAPRGPRGAIREIFACTITRDDAELVLEVTGGGFLRHMVRNLAGLLMDIGRRRRQPGEIPGILAACDRRSAGPMAPAKGLCLVAVSYPDENR
ncbi:MAG: tRNA pseudouridine synthase A [Terriglobales bacterium]